MNRIRFITMLTFLAFAISLPILAIAEKESDFDFLDKHKDTTVTEGKLINSFIYYPPEIKE